MYICVQLPETSYDVCDDDEDPFIASNMEYHGTAVAGVIVGARSNDQCGTGIAYNARIGSEFNFIDYYCMCFCTCGLEKCSYPLKILNEFHGAYVKYVNCQLLLCDCIAIILV